MPGLLGIGGSGGYNYSGYSINPQTGQVTVTDSQPDEYNQALTEYLRTGTWTSLGAAKDKYISDAKQAIDQLLAQGYKWDSATNTGGMPNQGNISGSAPGAPSMERFFTSPDYQFRRNEGQRDIGNSFAARGGRASGNALKALAEYNSNLASSEFGNYFNRLGTMAGLGTAANSQNQQAGQTAANNISNGLMAQGDAR